MPNDDVANRVKTVLRETVGLSEASVQQKNLSLFSTNGRIDSVSLLLLVMGIEKQFGILVDDKEVRPKNFRSLRALTAFIERKLASRQVA